MLLLQLVDNLLGNWFLCTELAGTLFGERFPCTELAENMVAVAVAVAGAVAAAAAATATAAVASRNNIIHGKALKRYSHAYFKTQDQIIRENIQ